MGAEVRTPEGFLVAISDNHVHIPSTGISFGAVVVGAGERRNGQKPHMVEHCVLRSRDEKGVEFLSLLETTSGIRYVSADTSPIRTCFEFAAATPLELAALLVEFESRFFRSPEDPVLFRSEFGTGAMPGRFVTELSAGRSQGATTSVRLGRLLTQESFVSDELPDETRLRAWYEDEWLCAPRFVLTAGPCDREILEPAIGRLATSIGSVEVAAATGVVVDPLLVETSTVSIGFRGPHRGWQPAEWLSCGLLFACMIRERLFQSAVDSLTGVKEFLPARSTYLVDHEFGLPTLTLRVEPGSDAGEIALRVGELFADFLDRSRIGAIAALQQWRHEQSAYRPGEPCYERRFTERATVAALYGGQVATALDTSTIAADAREFLSETLSDEFRSRIVNATAVVAR